MNRLRQRQVEVIAEALNYVPARLRLLVECDVFCGDPVFAGLHGFEMTDQGPDWPARSYRRMERVCYPYHARDKRTTLVLPGPTDVGTVIHELGHVLHRALWERAGWSALPDFEPVTAYARTDYFEAFAEAFTGWFMRPDSPHYLFSRSNREFFDRLGLA